MRLKAEGSVTAAGTDDVCVLWLFFRTRQLNGTCASSVDMELFLHYSLIPSVSEGRGASGREGRGAGLLPYTVSQGGLNRSAESFSYIMYQKHRQKRALSVLRVRDTDF